MKPENFYLVVWNDQMGLCVPMGDDPDCEGALMASDKPVLFPTRAEARAAIRISCRYAELVEAQGGIANGDFLSGGRRNVRILTAQVKRV